MCLPSWVCRAKCRMFTFLNKILATIVGVKRVLCVWSVHITVWRCTSGFGGVERFQTFKSNNVKQPYEKLVLFLLNWYWKSLIYSTLYIGVLIDNTYKDKWTLFNLVSHNCLTIWALKLSRTESLQLSAQRVPLILLVWLTPNYPIL